MSLAPPVSRDGFAYAGRDLYAEASNHNRHRRATLAELREHFASSTSAAEHPAHWFEAQLMHYGLPVSKNKGTARMRLHDAMNSGNLVVPAHVAKLEADLKKEWTKNEREAKKALKDATSGGGGGGGGAKGKAAAAAGGTKRKAESSNVDVVINVGGIDIKVSANNANAASTSSAAKKAKTTSGTAAATKKAPSAGPAKPSPKPKAAAAAKPSPKPKAAAAATPKPKAAPKPKATAAASPSVKKEPKSKPRLKKEESDEEDVKLPPPRPRTKQTARRTITAPFPQGPISGGGVKMEDEEDVNDPPRYDPSLPPLGLLNGRYTVTSDNQSSLILTIAGNALWGRFDLPDLEGVFWLEKRPAKSTTLFSMLAWRGRDTSYSLAQGEPRQGFGFIRFPGGGRVEFDTVCRPNTTPRFVAERLPGQGTRSEIDAAGMWRDWLSFAE